jgi:hypothetical protein
MNPWPPSETWPPSRDSAELRVGPGGPYREVGQPSPLAPLDDRCQTEDDDLRRIDSSREISSRPHRRRFHPMTRTKRDPQPTDPETRRIALEAGARLSRRIFPPEEPGK